MRISFSVVFYKNSIAEVNKIVSNIIHVIPSEYEASIFLVNNCSEDVALTQNLNSLANEYRKQSIFVIDSENHGFGAGHNIAIARAQSDFHFIVNPDVTIPSTEDITKMVDYMVDNQVVLLSPLIKYPDGRVQHLVKRDPTVLDMLLRFMGTNVAKKRQEWFTYQPHGYEMIHSASNFPGSFLAFKTSTLQEVGGFDERYFLYMEDSDISRSMAGKGKAVFFPEASVVHSWQRQNRKSFRGVLQMISSMIKYFNKWGWKFW